MNKSIPVLHLVLDFGGSGTKVAASLNDEKPIFFLMPPQCEEIDQKYCYKDSANESSSWVSVDGTHYAVGLLAQKHSGKTIKVKPLKVESAPIKSLVAIAIAAKKFNINKKIRLSLSIVLPSGEYSQSSILKEELESLIEKKIDSPAGSLQLKLWTFNAGIEGKGILLHHRRETKAIRNTLILMLGYRNASFIATQGKLIASTGCSDIGFHSFLGKIVSLTTGYSIEQLLMPITRYGATKDKDESLLLPVLRFSLDSPHRPKELVDLKAAIAKAEEFYVQQLVDWLGEFLSVSVDEIVLAGGSTNYIGRALAGKLAGKFVPSKRVICAYRNDILPSDLIMIQDGDRFLDVHGIWHQLHNSKVTNIFTQSAEIRDYEVI